MFLSDYLKILTEDLSPAYQSYFFKIFFNNSQDKNFLNWLWEDLFFHNNKVINWEKYSEENEKVFQNQINIIDNIKKNKDKNEFIKYFEKLKENYHQQEYEKLIKSLIPLMKYWVNKNNISKDRNKIMNNSKR